MNAEMEDFNRFIIDMELVDLHVLGNEFTWCSSDGSAKSRLNKILVSEGLISKWNIVVQQIGLRDISDHKLVWIICCNID